MEVKDITLEVVSPDLRPERDSLSNRNKVEEPAVAVETSHHSGDSRTEINHLIDMMNLAVSVTDEITALFTGVSGIVDQLGDKNITEKRASVLAKEAEELVNAIRNKANESSYHSVKPLAGDRIRFEAERELGKTLDLILPDSATKAFGLVDLDFSRKDAIISARSAVARAEAQLEELRSAVSKSKESVLGAITEFEIALQNSEASRSSLRDLEEAMLLAGVTSDHIGSAPREAVNSHKRVNSSVVELLK